MKACGGASVPVKKIDRLDSHGCEEGVRAEGSLATEAKPRLLQKATTVRSNRHFVCACVAVPREASLAFRKQESRLSPFYPTLHEIPATKNETADRPVPAREDGRLQQKCS